MEFIDVTKVFIVGVAIVMIGYYIFQLRKEKKHPSIMTRKQFLLLTALYWAMIALLSLGRWTLYFCWC